MMEILKMEIETNLLEKKIECQDWVLGNYWTNSNLLLLSDNRTNKYLPSLRRWNTKDNRKNMDHEMWNYKEKALIRTSLNNRKMR